MLIIGLIQVVYESISKIGVNTGVNQYDITFMRQFISFIVSSIIIKIHNKHPIDDLPKDCRLALLVRSLCGVFGFIFVLNSLHYLPITIFCIIYNTTPFWSGALGYVINKEKITCFDLACMVGAFVGIAVISLSKNQVPPVQVNQDDDDEK